MHRLRRPDVGRPALLVWALLLAVALVVAPASGIGTGPDVSAPPRGDSRGADPASPRLWERVFFDGFDGPAGASPEQWHSMVGFNGAAQTGQGQLDVGHLSQVRTHEGWTLPVGTRVRATVSLMMPDTGTNYAALWLQHPNGAEPREIDVIESYGPLKPTGAQVGSHICYDEMVGVGTEACEVSGMPAELWPVSHAFPAGAEPWNAYWQYAAEFTIGADTVQYSAADGGGQRLYSVTSTPDPRRVPSDTVPFHLRLSNKDVEPQHALPGGERHSMLVDWVSVEVKHP